jgi:hypothetical protein
VQQHHEYPGRVLMSMNCDKSSNLPLCDSEVTQQQGPPMAATKHIKTITANVVRRFVDPEPFELPTE